VSLSAEEIQKIVTQALTEAKGRRTLANQSAEKAFLEANARKTGVVVASQGLQYEVLTQGSGTSPRDADVVTLKYRATLADGTEFENRTDKAIDVPVAKLLPGVAQGVKLMAPGARYRFYLPSSLAYGDKGRGENIEPNVPLVYEVELLSVGASK
jgi:FKBP-type peptidyl-prolyl cis-trans isomerase